MLIKYLEIKGGGTIIIKKSLNGHATVKKELLFIIKKKNYVFFMVTKRTSKRTIKEKQTPRDHRRQKAIETTCLLRDVRHRTSERRCNDVILRF